ncbi:MAG TPA: EamA family transporter, partial [Solirubrobacteraceae bacterium]|nr:EamA family transporter [Solirubrobacteraceae bacterium]
MRLWIALWTVYLVWGSTYLAIRYVVETMPALLSAGVRFFAAGALFAAWLVARRGVAALRVTRAELLGCAIVGIALLLGGNGLVSVGEDQGVPSGLAALVIASIPLWVVVFRRVAGERVGRMTPLWIVVGFAGVAVLLLPGDRPDDAPIGGMLVLVAAAFCWASGSFASSRLSIPDDPIRATTLQMLIGGGVMALVGLAAGEGGQVDVGAFSWESIAAFAYLVLIGSLCAFTAYAWLLKNAPISQVATYAYVNPIVAIALGALFVNEEVTPL